VQLPDDVVADVRRRLRRVAGQVSALDRMLADGRDCRDVLVQLSAASHALERAGFKLVAAGLAYCAEHPEEADEGLRPEVLERLFLRLA
jgi:DNA-binding FrmR family transcriptional regulator